jgi:hypothetical protein
MFNTFNNDNNVNPLSTPALFNFDGFLRTGVRDPRLGAACREVDFLSGCVAAERHGQRHDNGQSDGCRTPEDADREPPDKANATNSAG